MKTSLVTAGVVGGLGVSLVLGGCSWLTASSARHGYLRASKAQRWATAGLAAGAFGLSTVITTMVWGLDSVGCST